MGDFLTAPESPDRVQADQWRESGRIQILGQQWSIDIAGMDRIDTDALLGIGQRCRTCQTSHAVLGRGIGRRIGLANQTQNRSDIDNRRGTGADTGIINREMQCTKRLLRAFNHRFHLYVIGDISDIGNRLATCGIDRIGDPSG